MKAEENKPVARQMSRAASVRIFPVWGRRKKKVPDYK